MKEKICVNINNENFRKLRNDPDFLEVCNYPRIDEATRREIGKMFIRGSVIHFYLENHGENIKYTMLIVLKQLHRRILEEKAYPLTDISEIINFLERQ